MLRYRILCILVLLAAAAAFIAVNNAYALMVLLILVAVFLFGGVMAWVSTRAQVELSVPSTRVTRQDLPLSVRVSRPIPLMTCGIELLVEDRNIMTGARERIALYLEPEIARISVFEHRLDGEVCGVHEYRVLSADACGPFGLMRFSLDLDWTGRCVVYPRSLDLSARFTRSPRTDVYGQAYDQRRRGQDASEVFDIREYQPTDPMRAVHWKLSSKLDKLMVREASRPSSYDAVVMLDRRTVSPSGKPISGAVITGLVEMASALSFDLHRQGVCHNFAFGAGERIADAEIDSLSAYEDALDEVLATPMLDSATLDRSLLDDYLNHHDFSKVVLFSAAVDDEWLAELSRFVDVVVVCYSGEVNLVDSDEGGYSLIVIPPDMLDERVKSLVI